MKKVAAMAYPAPFLHVSLLWLAFLFFAVLMAVPAGAEEATPEDPTYEECFKMAQKAIEGDMVAMQLEADTLGDDGNNGWTTPATLPPSASDNVTIGADPQDQRAILPGLQGTQDFEQALREQGVRIVIDPTDPTGAPKIELDNMRPVEPKTPPQDEVSEPAGEEQTEDKPMTSAELYQFKRTVCRIKFGITF